MTFVEKIKKSDLCIGCGYCASFSSRQMEYDRNGFLVPSSAGPELTRSEEALVKAACPGKNAEDVFCTDDATPEVAVDHLWGPYTTALTGFATHAETRHTGSSGGVLTALSRYLVETGQVDGVLSTTYDEAYPVGTSSEVTDDADVLLRAGGSKYCPASPLATLDYIRDNPGTYAVVGRPCDIATLRRAIKAGDPVGDRIAYLFSFFCAGTPSDTGNRKLVSDLGVRKFEDLDYLRHRGNGWPGDTVAKLKDGSEKTCTYNQSWGGILRNYTHNLCKICTDGIGEQADIVAADAWYGDDEGYPVFEESDGRSLIMARTPIGEKLLRAAMADGWLATEAFDLRQLDQMQVGQTARRLQLLDRVRAFRAMGLPTPRYRQAALRQYARGVPLSRRIMNFGATVRRIIRKRMKKAPKTRRIS
ncbi:Coenzyme F420 hydrogenase/dehydrogenase, beta subunit C-terminal domain [Erythrobacteraceae bacterium WH01K]|nr:Coenzyme F420 hydrogenase/dehydrogenase, beta subunit C-terminal domain [Erythrobacteraceae bacterium WH01K]